MTALEALYNEIHDAGVRGVLVSSVRVTADALAGSIVLLPVTPERAQTMSALRLYADGTIAVDPRHACLLYEVVIHPEDWLDVLVDAAAANLGVVRDRIWGVPVV